MYMSQGIPPAHLIAASVMAAPGALAVSKLMYPETSDKAKASTKDLFTESADDDSSKTKNFIDAISSGASLAISLVLNIGANLIAFLAMLDLVNAVLAYLGARVGLPELTFELICSYLFMPVAFILGIPWGDCQDAAQLIGTKLFINEFVAFGELSKMMPLLQRRSVTILTYALCGFANISSLGISIGGLSALAPHRRQDVAKLAPTALIAGTLTNLLTACVAGVISDPNLESEALPEDPFSGSNVVEA